MLNAHRVGEERRGRGKKMGADEEK